MNYDAEKELIWPCEFLIDNDEIWIFHGKINALVKYDLKKETAITFGGLPYCNSDIALIQRMLKHRNDLYLIPGFAPYIYIYYIERNEFVKIDIPEVSVLDKFSDAFFYDNSIICVPYAHHSIIRVDCETKKVMTVLDLHKQFARLGISGEWIFSSSVIDSNGNIYGLIKGTNRILKYGLQDEKIEVIELGHAENIYNTMTFRNGKLYLTNYKEKSLTVYDIEDKRELSITVDFDMFIVYHLLNDDYMIDSITDERYIVCDSDNNVKKSNSKKGYTSKGAFDYDYYHGLMRNDGKKDYYFDRNDCHLDVIENGVISKTIKIFMGDIVKKGINLQTNSIVLRENNLWDLNFLIQNI